MDEQTFPAWFYGPDGEARIFAAARDVPEGWTDRPCAAAPAEPAGEADPFDHDGDGEPGGSLPGKRPARRKVKRRGAGK